MKPRFPKTPFATRLSSDGKETQLRLRSIFQWQKKRPPMAALAVVLALCIGCGGLVAWRSAPTPAPGQDLFVHYRDDLPFVDYLGAQTFSYGDRTLVLEQPPANQAEELVLKSYLCTAGLSFDQKAELAGSEVLRASIANEKESAREGRYHTSIVLHALSTLSREDFQAGSPYFAQQEQADRFVEDLAVDVQQFGLQEYTVVCADLSWTWSQAALDAGPQLDSGRYERLFLLGHSGDEAWKLYQVYWGEYVFERTLSPVNTHLEETLAQLALPEADYPAAPQLTTLLSQTVGERSVMLVQVEGAPHISGLSNLVLGVYDPQRQSFVGDTFRIHGDEPGYTFWWGTDGYLYLLWTNTIYYQGDGTSNGLGYFRFDGQSLQPLYDLPAAARNCGFLPDTPQTQALLHPVDEQQDSHDFWFGRKARPISQGFELYEKNPDWMPGEEEQWVYQGYIPFAVTDRTVTQRGKDLILEYIETGWYGYDRTYYLGEEPGDPQPGDQRIDGVYYAGEERTDETVGVAFRVERSYYDHWGSQYPEPFWMEDPGFIYVILGRDAEGEIYTDVRGYAPPSSEQSLNQMILEVSYGLMDLEVSLWRDGYPFPAGPGSEIPFFDPADEVPHVEVLENREPSYRPGDYWTRQSWEGFSALCYHVGPDDPDAYQSYTIDTTRTDLRTYRGIRVGATRTDVLKAYSVLYDTEYWNAADPDFPGEDYLWYCVNSEGFGAALLFFFEDDIVTHIRLDYMFY